LLSEWRFNQLGHLPPLDFDRCSEVLLTGEGHGPGCEKGWGSAACLAAHNWGKGAGQVTPPHIWKEGQGEGCRKCRAILL